MEIVNLTSTAFLLAYLVVMVIFSVVTKDLKSLWLNGVVFLTLLLGGAYVSALVLGGTSPLVVFTSYLLAYLVSCIFFNPLLEGKVLGVMFCSFVSAVICTFVVFGIVGIEQYSVGYKNDSRGLSYVQEVSEDYPIKNAKLVAKYENDLNYDSSHYGMIGNTELETSTSSETYLEYFYDSGGTILNGELLLSDIKIEEHDSDSFKLSYITTNKTSYNCHNSLSDNECNIKYKEYASFTLGERLVSMVKPDITNISNKVSKKWVLYVPKGFDLNKLYSGVGGR